MNARGHEFGFVRYVNMKCKDKLSQSLNIVWIGECRVWAREARFDRFAHNGLDVNTSNTVVREERGEVRPVVHKTGEGV